MEKVKAIFKTAWPYKEDKMNLPVENLEAAIPFYETIMGFQLVSRTDSPHKSAVFSRESIQIGLAENGGDATQEGCFFEVNNAEKTFAELKSNGLDREKPVIDIEKHGDISWKVFYIVAPDGLCYCFGEQQT